MDRDFVSVHKNAKRELGQFKVDRPQTTVVAKNLSLLQLFISRMPKMCAILQLVSAPLISSHLEKNQYPAILNSRLVNNIYISNKREWNNCFIKNAPKMSSRLFYLVRRTLCYNVQILFKCVHCLNLNCFALTNSDT